jgi:hypothetical protein
MSDEIVCDDCGGMMTHKKIPQVCMDCRNKRKQAFILEKVRDKK